MPESRKQQRMVVENGGHGRAGPENICRTGPLKSSIGVTRPRQPCKRASPPTFPACNSSGLGESMAAPLLPALSGGKHAEVLRDRISVQMAADLIDRDRHLDGARTKLDEEAAGRASQEGRGTEQA